MEASASSTAARMTAPPSATSGVYAECDPCDRSCGASLAPITAPATIPTTDSALATSPLRSPMKAARATKPTANQSTRVTRG